jgi:hypothetical protein
MRLRFPIFDCSTKRLARRALSLIFWSCACVWGVSAQGTNSTPVPAPEPTQPVLTHRHESSVASEPGRPADISLTVATGTAIQVALEAEVRIREEGQIFRGILVEPIYAFDRLVVPVGTEVSGRITHIEPVSVGKRTLAALDADFTPARAFEVEFNDLIFTDGRHIPIHTVVTPGSGQVIRFLSAKDEKSKSGVKDEVSGKAAQGKAAARQQWDAAMQQVKQPGKIHRAERYAIAQLPVHPQYIDAGSVYFAELQEPLEFGSEPLTQEMVTSLGSNPPPGSFVHARLVTPLSSATTRRGAEVDAVLSRPLFDGGQLILPQGSRLKGSVVQVQPARYMSRNGQLRIVFHELSSPDGPNGTALAQKVDANLEGVQSSKTDNVKLDAEGGAEATTSKTRYLQTAIAIGLAVVSAGGDADAAGPNPAGNTLNRAAGGANGFKLVGITMGVLVHSRVFGYSMGAYGAGMSIYTHFVAKGRDVVFPKNTAMDIAIGIRETPATKSSSQAVRSE